MLALQASRQFLKLPVLGIVTLWTVVFLYRYFWQHEPDHSDSVAIASKISTQLTAPFHQKVSSDYSIKPIVYIFPQYYPFEQNDKFWGVNFTEWDNVRKADHNKYGLETIRPHPSIGYYNGLEFATRERHGRLIRDNGFHGLVYHHYWMSGIPVMDHILQAMLLDGEPNVPFMLSWANGPWTLNWDGLDSGVTLLAQDYGDVADWRKHFEWLLPFFRHPNYIRSNGKIQFLLYGPRHLTSHEPGLKFHMHAAFRKWAIEEGLGGMEIIETREGENPPGPPPDATNEFQPHTGGMNHESQHLVQRNSHVYHRGSLICWDTTPRHATDGRAQVWPMCHPKSWTYHMVRAMKTIKADPNPKGHENFLFINALNEWGEGSTIEPTIQFGNGYAEAMKEAVRISEEKHIWQSEDIARGLERTKAYEATINKTIDPPDVCVLIHTSTEYDWNRRFTLDDMIRSLQAQHNSNWKAVVFATDGTGIGGILQGRLDHRLKEVHIPKGVNDTDAYDWVIRNLTDADPACWSAKYMLATKGGNEYAPTAFDAVATSKADFVALNVESRWTVYSPPPLGAGDLCTRLENPLTKLSRPSGPTATEFDLSGTFISLSKFSSMLESNSAAGDAISSSLDLRLSSYPASVEAPFNQEGGALVEKLVKSHGWSWDSPSTEGNHVLSNPSYTGCKESGHIWVDSMVFGETGCFSSPDIGALYGGGWQGADLQFYRQHGWCTKKKLA